MSTNNKLVNAWIFLNEDEPKVNNQPVGYNDPQSCYQTLIQNNVYQAMDMLNICFVTTLPTSSTTLPVGNGSSYTVEMGAVNPPHPGGLTNQDYMNNVISDSRNNNPNLKILVTLNWGDDTVLSNIFANSNYTDQQNADNFAANLLQYLIAFDLDGFDIDWESPLSGSITKTQFALLVNAIRAQFNTQTNKHYYLTLSPAEVGNLDGNAVNASVDFLNLQLYSGFTFAQDFINAGVNQDLLAYGAKFESNYQTGQDAYNQANAGGYYVITQWRLNSDNFQFEQTQQVDLYNLVFPQINNLNKTAKPNC